MPEIAQKPELSRSLEDYLVAIWSLIQEKQFARVKNIAAYRGVKPGSVSPALAKLAKLELIVYERREFVLLTPMGTEIATTLIRRQQLLKEFFEKILKISAPLAQQQACAVEHCLSEESTVRLEELIHFLRSSENNGIFAAPKKQADEVSISALSPGQEGTVRLIRARGELHHQLIDMGLLPDSKIKLVDKTNEHVPAYLVALQGFEITLTHEQAQAVVVSM